MKATDSNLAEVLQTLSPAERAVVEFCLRPAATPSESEATAILQRETLRKLRARLKRRARRRPEAKHRWLM